MIKNIEIREPIMTFLLKIVIPFLYYFQSSNCKQTVNNCKKIWKP